jgi:hypothetical protein
MLEIYGAKCFSSRFLSPESEKFKVALSSILATSPGVSYTPFIDVGLMSRYLPISSYFLFSSHIY